MIREHHPTLSPSSLPAKTQCPSWQGNDEPSEAAEAGTRQHEFIADHLQGKSQDGYDKHGLTSEEGIQCMWAIAHIMDLCKGNPLVEEKVEIVDDDFNEITFGYFDFCSQDGSVLIDYKSGEIHDYQAQLSVLALGLMQRFGTKSVHCYELYGRSKNIVDYIVYYDDAMLRLRMIAESVKSRMVMNVCEYCAWCAQAVTCPAAHNKAIEVANGYKNASFQTWHASEVTDPHVMGRMLALADIVEDWAESVKFHVKSQACSGNVATGYKIRRENGRRKIDNLQAVFEKSKLPAEKFINLCDVKLKDLQAAMLMKPAEFDKFIDPLCVRGEDVIKLVKERKNG